MRHSVIADYSIDAAMVRVVPGGASLDEALLISRPTRAAWPGEQR